jgi:hypothetical protein
MATMTIHSSRSSRLFMAAFLGPMSLLLVLIAAYTVMWLHLWYGVIPLVVASFLGYGAYAYGRDATLSSDGAEVVFIRPVGQPQHCSKADVTRIDHVWGARSTSEIRFVRRDGGVVMKVDNAFSRSDLERLAEHLGVPLNWDGRSS